MTQRIRMWEVTNSKTPVEVPASRIKLEESLEDWLASDISMLDPGLLVIGRQVRTDFGKFMDLLCLDSNGNTVVIELKKNKTAREVTAQALEYASWVKDLSFQDISKRADGYFGSEGSLENAFVSRFKTDLPDELNSTHRVLIVAESLDESTERIVQYLSEMNVPINVATVQHFRDNSEREFLAQVFLVEPAVAEVRANLHSKKRQLPNSAQMVALADEQGVGELYNHLLAGSSGIMTNASFGNTSRGFSVKDEGKSSAIFVIELGESGSDQGLMLRMNGSRLMNFFDLSSEQLDTILPEERSNMDAKDWRGTTEEERANWTGYRCYFRSTEELDNFISCIRSSIE
ncbi:MAG: endonuclease NucS [Chloroflexota bacterium]|nr:endonuclease NucS [Chloroflexota bacterium]